ncbi:MAG: ABC transporter substrate-binding protein [Rhodovibrionaceae bacterium]|nr:ABC transporter substrate-binding protein [Rhodovibrionaceae bacterium]
MRPITGIISTFVLAFALTLSIPAAAEAPREAAKPVERLNETLLETMKNAQELGYEGRREKLAPVLRDIFDFAFMARVSVGRHWQDLSEAERETLIEEFSQMSIATYAARFAGYSGQSFEVSEPREGPRDSILVPSHLRKPNGEIIELDYLVRGNGEDWQIIDVFLKGSFSELATKRAEYTSVIKRAGFDKLISHLDDKQAKLRSASKQ